MAVLERDEDDAVIDANGRAVGESEIIGARRQADIVDDALALVLGDDFADLVFDWLEQRSVASTRMPAGPRTCNWIWPLSIMGKKSRPTRRT